MTKRPPPSTPRGPSLLALLLLAVSASRIQACDNNPGQRIAVRVNSVRTSRRCRKITKRLHCELTDLLTNKAVKQVCRDQCLKRCQQARTEPTIPPGPYVTSASNSKLIKLPNPPVPKILRGTARTNCPHLMTGLKLWHDPATWPNNVIPSAGSNVTLPVNTKVLIDRPVVQKLGVITVPKSSQLIIGERAKGITLLVRGVDVRGRLIAGSETCRIEKPITITLWGARPSNVVQNVPSPTSKGIVVTGTLSLHGKRYYATWSRLAKTIRPGESVLLLQQRVNWEPGQKVVITSSIIYDSRSYHQNEVVTVLKIEKPANTPAGVGAVVHLQQPVNYKHVANEYYQVEAGLLSRMILIQGLATDSEPKDLDPLTCRTNTAQYPFWHFLYNLTMPCTNTEKTGYGGHVMVMGNGKARVEGIELYRMGQTNVLGRYPMHMHVLGNCPTCYFRDSSVHRSFYRCISVHGTNQATVSENVAYNVIGFCYYLEDGVEEDNTISFNLAAHVHTIGPDLPSGNSQGLNTYSESKVLGSELTLPADVAAAGFYITNVHNNIIGNAASGGWAGFAFPVLEKPIGLHKDVLLRPGNANSLKIDGNTAHSTGFWWEHAGAFYVGGSLYYVDNMFLRYNPGRGDFGRDARFPCSNYTACVGANCRCREEDTRPLTFTNSKTFLTAGVGLNSWTGDMDVNGFEAYDQRLAIESLSDGFWINRMFVACRTGEDLGLPSPGTAAKLEGSGFYWYDTGQSHIITNSIFQNCGYRSDDFNQYDNTASRGCGTKVDSTKGCHEGSTTFGFLTHSDQFVPEVMQATKNLSFRSCGRRFKFTRGWDDTVSGRCQNWLDYDGTASGLNEPVLIGSGLPSSADWWGVDDDVIFDTQGPVSFIKQNNGPGRGLAHVYFSWDKSLHDKTGGEFCINGGGGKPCPTHGHVRHLGPKFSPSKSGVSQGLPITVNPDTVGPVGGFGWVLKLKDGAPRELTISQIEIDPEHVLLLSIAYPVGTVFNISARAEPWCWDEWNGKSACREYMTAVNSVKAVRDGPGNTYHVDSNGVLTLRLFQIARTWTGDPDWFGIPTYDMIARDKVNFAIPRYERSGVRLPKSTQASFLIQAMCSGTTTGVFCTENVVDYDPDVCQPGYEQVAYDKCCSKTVPGRCTFADGTTT